MILRSVGIAGAIVVGLAVASALTLLPALLVLVGSRLDRFAVRPVTPTARTDGAWARLARRVMRHPVAVLVPTLAFLLLLGSPFLHVRFNAPDASILPPEVPSRAAFDRLTANFGEGEFAPIVLAHPDDRAGHDPGQPRRPLRLLAPPRGGPPDLTRRQPGRRRPAPDAGPVLAALRRPERTARSVRPDRARRDDQRRHHGVHHHHPVRPEPRRGPIARRGPSRAATVRSRRRPASRSSSEAAPRTSPTSSTASAPTSRGRRCSSS